MIIVKLSGGLGNQLFQFAFAKALSERLGATVKFDVHTKYRHAGFTHRELALKSWGVDIELANEKEISEFRLFLGEGVLSRMERLLVKIIPANNPKYYVQKHLSYEDNSKMFRDNCYYDGYWQSEKYFKDIKSRITRELCFSVPLSRINSTLAEEIERQQSVSIHVRRNDYISVRANRKIFEICTMDYYSKAIEWINKKYINPKFYVFSDDIEWVKNNFIGKEFIFVYHNYLNPEVDMYLMSRCNSNIIANSTFSWWGAWLNANPDKTVIVPKKWYRGKISNNEDSIIPNDWFMM